MITFLDIALVWNLTLISTLWLGYSISYKVALLNLLPTIIFFSLCYFFSKHYLERKFRSLYLFQALFLTLRLPVNFNPDWQIANLVCLAGIIIPIIAKLGHYLRERNLGTVFFLTGVIILLNSATHLSLNSPLTYSFRITNVEKSNFTPGVDNNTTWECSYEGSSMVVGCDSRHFIPSEKIFYNDLYKANFSVFLDRFFFGYLSSLAGLNGYSWISNFILNLFLWLGACLAIFRIGEIFQFEKAVNTTALLCAASAWGFIQFVGQPGPRMAAIAFSALILWAALELIISERKHTPLSYLIIFAGCLTYEVFPLIVLSSLLLFINKKYFPSALILVTCLGLRFIWKNLFLKHVLGTLGETRPMAYPSNNIGYSLDRWKEIYLNSDYLLSLEHVLHGLQSYLYGSMIIGALACIWFTINLVVRRRNLSSVQKLQLQSVFWFTLLIVGSMVLMAPSCASYSPNTKLVPRFGYYLYPINLLAISFFCNKYLSRYLYMLPLFSLIIANLTLTGLATMSVFFEYGMIGWYWQ